MSRISTWIRQLTWMWKRKSFVHCGLRRDEGAPMWCVELRPQFVVGKGIVLPRRVQLPNLGSSGLVRLTTVLATCILATGGSTRAGELERFAGMKGKIDIAGGTAHIPVMNKAAKRIMQTNRDIRITVAGGGSGVGVKKVGTGLVDIGNTGRPLSDKERTGHGLISFPFAIDGVAVAVSPGNPVSGLTAEQVRRIFAGAIVNWKDVGCAGGHINLYTRDEASGTRAVFWKKLLKKGPVADKANVVPSNGAMKVAVGRDPRGIGYVSIGHVDTSIKALALDGVAASQKNAASGTYPVVRKLFMNTKGQPSPLVRAFIDYIQGIDGAGIIKNAGYIPLSTK